MRSQSDAAIVLRLRGGLGNQIFEYAAARSMALRNNVPLFIDTISGFRQDVYGRSYDLGAFKVVGEKFDSTVPISFGMWSEVYRRALARREQWRMRYLGEYFDPVILRMRVNRPVTLDAYCQSYRYFSDIQDVLRAELEFCSVPEGLSPEVVQDVSQQNSVCLHVRRLHGKEASGARPEAVASYYGSCELSYYLRSIRELASLHGYLRIFLFSDEIGWAKENIAAFRTEFGEIRVIDDPDPLRSFYLMRLCTHYVIANSTFSWWAAWLGQNPLKTVCVPSVWNRGERRFPRGLFPDAWKVIPSDSCENQSDADNMAVRLHGTTTSTETR
jgi:hypothetical protein